MIDNSIESSATDLFYIISYLERAVIDMVVLNSEHE